MTILIGINELEEEFQIPWKMGLVNHLVIDYADNAIYGTFEKKEVIIFRFKKYGWVCDNRYNLYTLSSGEAGIMINMNST
jgi:hypothetical protein